MSDDQRLNDKRDTYRFPEFAEDIPEPLDPQGKPLFVQTGKAGDIIFSILYTSYVIKFFRIYWLYSAEMLRGKYFSNRPCGLTQYYYCGGYHVWNCWLYRK